MSRQRACLVLPFVLCLVDPCLLGGTAADPDYPFLGNRARFRLRGRFPRAEVTLAAQYGTMNLNEGFVTVQARPRTPLGLRLDLRGVNLASPADLWYAGSGATLGEGSVFGYTGRRSNGSTRLGTSVEASADYAVTPHLAVPAFLGTIGGGRVVTGTFQGSRLWYGYLETAIAFSTR